MHLLDFRRLGRTRYGGLGKGEPVISTVSLDGALRWVAIEPPWLDNASYVSCIPSNTYKLGKGSFHGKPHYCVLDVPDRSGIFIHVGNYMQESLGCPMLGQSISIGNDGNLMVSNSGAAISDFHATMDAIWKEHEIAVRFS